MESDRISSCFHESAIGKLVWRDAIASRLILITQRSLLKIITMTLRELEDQALRLSAEDRWQLINTLVRSLQPKLQPTSKAKGLAASLIGIAKTDTLPPTDEEVKAMLDERLVQKYL
ncbi:hypothetical protein [Nostoc sp. NMS7]|uniref:hypothetical protein n=1 Tax=Nostoc sp. NMS7 TaxID=2815391 RepID=UPI0025D7CF43|nr:hypothetical protein [Nostoc sp. NMS7]